MLLWIFIGATAAVVTFVFLKKMDRSAKSINNYFCDSVLLYCFTGSETGRLAALAAAKTAAGAQRASMVDYLLGLSTDMKAVQAEETEQFRERIKLLHELIIEKEWTVSDSAKAKSQLAAIDPEAMHGLNKSNGNYFRQKYPEVFDPS